MPLSTLINPQMDELVKFIDSISPETEPMHPRDQTFGQQMKSYQDDLSESRWQDMRGTDSKLNQNDECKTEDTT